MNFIDTNNMTLVSNVESFCHNYIFFDGLIKKINYDLQENYCYVKIECRNLHEKWLILSLYMQDVDLIRLIVKNGDLEIISSPLCMFYEKDSGKLLITFDDNNEYPMIQSQNFIIRARKIFYSELYDY